MLSRKVRASSWCAAVALLLAREIHAINLAPAETDRIGRKVWQNECDGSVAGLTSWNAGENFASLGIGHFIWYPTGARGPFEESFPPLVEFVAARGAKLPEFLAANPKQPCPWNSRAEFERDAQSARMKELRQFLAATVAFQAEFLVQRLHNAVPKMLQQAPPADRGNVKANFDRVAATSQGCYALVDYVNFKGDGTLATERYRGQGWGLLQVLQGMNADAAGSAVGVFARSAREVLQRRVQNSPPERGERRWLAGWLSRVASYARS